MPNTSMFPELHAAVLEDDRECVRKILQGPVLLSVVSLRSPSALYRAVRGAEAKSAAHAQAWQDSLQLEELSGPTG